MSIPTIHVTKGYNEPAFYPMCAGSGRIARAIDAAFLTPEFLGALQAIGVSVIADGELSPDLTPPTIDRGLEPIGDVLARLPNHNRSIGD